MATEPGQRPVLSWLFIAIFSQCFVVLVCEFIKLLTFVFPAKRGPASPSKLFLFNDCFHSASSIDGGNR